MMGHAHALSGLAVGAATLPGVHTANGYEAAAWVAAVGGFAMLPDLDSGGIHWRGALPKLNGSKVAIMWGPFTCMLAKGVAKVAGGHRNGTHSLLGLVVTAVLAILATFTFPTRVFLLALAIGLALQALSFAIPGRLEETWIVNLAASFAASWWLLTAGDGSPSWMPLAVVTGSVVHIAGDALTTGGVPLAWPFSSARQTLGLFKTGAWQERFLIAPACLVLACLLLWDHTGLSADTMLAALRGGD